MTEKQLQQFTQEKRIIAGVLIALVLMGGLYVYLVNQTVWNVVARKSLEKELGDASSVALLEREHAALRNAITQEHAHELGFRELATVSYVERDTLVVQVTE